MINNRQAGRRNRGRNNGRPSGGNRNGDNGNRIDNRARGNAPQLLEKYRNMARDAQLAGDRVNAEYYLQFADHYFRVLADNRSRQEEQSGQPQQARFRRNDEGFDDFGEDSEGSFEETGTQDFASADSEAPRGNNGRDPNRDSQREQGYQGRDQNRDGNRAPREYNNDRNTGRDRAADGNRQQENGGQDSYRNANGGRDRNRNQDRRPQPVFEPAAQVESSESAPVTPRVSDEDVSRVRTVRRGRPPRVQPEEPHAEPAVLDLAALPPAIARVEDTVAAEEVAPAVRKRGRPRKADAAAAE